jgi:hypothetical protein
MTDYQFRFILFVMGVITGQLIYIGYKLGQIKDKLR